MNIIEKDITEDNIQEIIKKVAIHWGIEMTQKIEKFEWIPIAMTSEVCEVCIPG